MNGFLRLLALAAGLLVSVPDVIAQIAPHRNSYVFHVYADAIFGDDVEAARMNPRFQNGIQPLAFHPDASSVPAADAAADAKTSRHVGGLLCHAPYSFRTIQAAIEYACTCGPTGIGWLLGSETPTGSEKFVAWIIIHCLPGIYSPWDRQNPADEFEPMSGMRRSGDVFPIELPYGISLQGTSALDTIIDARNSPEGVRTHAISIIEPGSAAAVPNRPYIVTSPLAQNINGEPTHPIASLARTFIDGFTIRGTDVYSDRNATLTSPRYSAGAGVFIARATGFWRESEEPGDAFALAPTVSNCFINHCGVGVAVIALQEDPNRLFTWRPLLVNNTFADNTYVDIYNGSNPGTGPMPGTPTGVNRLRVVNNICMGPGGANPQPFAGMHDTDLHVALAAPVVLINANAYPGGAAVPNAGSGWTNEWPLPVVDPNRMPLPVPVAPNVNTAALSSGDIFINRVFAATRGPISPHDYRLAPWSLAVFNPTTDPTGMRNPMVNAGITIAGAGGVMQFANGLLIDNVLQTAGLPQIASDATTNAEHPVPLPVEPFQIFNAWDTDADGFGNARVYTRPGFPDLLLGGIDLGADEVGDLVMAGYVDDTRMFTKITALMPSMVVPPVIVRPQIFFFDVPGVGTFNRPMANAVFGGLHWSGGITDWFVNMQVNRVPYSFPPTNYGSGGMEIWNATTSLALGSWRYGMLHPSLNQKQVPGSGGVTMQVLRNFACDFAPALAPDIQPLWMAFSDTVAIPSGCPSLLNITPSLLSPDPRDFFSANSWYCDPDNYRKQRQPADLSNPPTTGPCDLTIFTDNPYLYYNPSSGQTPDVGFPQSTAQTPTWHSNPTSGILHPPGTTIDMNLTGSTGPITPRLLVQAFGAFPFGPFAPCTTFSTTYGVGLDGVGDTSAGCPDEVPPLWSGNGIRINCMQGVNPATGFGTSNLQTFLIYARVVDAPGPTGMAASQSAARPGSPESLIRPATREEMVEGLRDRFQRAERLQR